MPNYAKTIMGFALAALLAGVFFVLGVTMGSDPGGRAVLRSVLPENLADATAEEVDFSLQQEVVSELRNLYYQELDTDELEEGAVRGMLSVLEDGYTGYLTSDEYDALMERTEGSYSGVGMVVETKAGFVTVVSVFSGSPAQESGIRPGDLIIGVEGESTRGMTLTEAVTKIKGPEGTDVELEIYRMPEDSDVSLDDIGPDGKLPAEGTTETFSVTRMEIDVPVVEKGMHDAGDKRVAYIKFFSFSEGSAARLREAVQEAVETDGADAIVLGLQNNGGGLLSEAVDVASIFIEDGVVVATNGLHSPEQTYEAEGDTYGEVPLYVLVNEFSASASEIVAGALQDHERATLVGETTFGKGLVQTIEPLSNNGALRVTTAVYQSPSGKNINDTGIEPDTVAPDDPDTPQVDETLHRALELIAGE